MQAIRSMRRRLAVGVLMAAVAGVPLLPAGQALGQPAPAAQPGKAAEVPVRAVVLFSSGVGYFEHFGPVSGDASTELRFKTNQINDIMKSLVLQDLGGGKVSTITYPSQDPIAKTLRSFQIDITSNPSLGELLNQLRGAKVRLTAGADHLEGTILGLEKKPKAVGGGGDKGDKGVIEVWVLNLISGGTIRSVELDQVQQIELEDKQLQGELTQALVALSQARDQDKKPVTIHFQGKGERQVRVGYVVETPVWKTSYRLILAADDKNDKDAKDEKAAGAAKPKLQGWAIVENQTDNDWNDVQLSLVSGRPISFIQDLYQPLYVPRPVVQPELYASLRPQTYEGGMENKKPMETFADNDAVLAPVAAGPAAKPMAMRKSASFREISEKQAQLSLNGELAQSSDYGFAGDGKPSRGPIDATASVSSLASASKMGELFQYTVGSVSLPRQRSAMIPIVTDDVEVERLSIYNPAVLPRNPLNGARVKNTTGKHLLAGPVTVLDGNAYAGDASIDNLPPGQERLISYGVDLQVLVDATKNRNESTIESGKIVKGVLYVSRRNVFTQEYQAENKGDKDKTLVVEHALRRGWKLVETDKDFVKPYETTEALYRFKGKVLAGKATKLVVKEQVVQGQTIAILGGDVGTLDWYVKNAPLTPAVRDALLKAAGFKNAMTDTQRQINEKQQQVNQITQEQTRIRENMKTVEKSGQYYTRLLAKLNDQETLLEKLSDELDAARKKLDAQRKDLENYLGDLNVDAGDFNKQ